MKTLVDQQEADLKKKDEQIKILRNALLPFSNAIFNDNGDITINTSISSESLIQAYWAIKKSDRIENE